VTIAGASTRVAKTPSAQENIIILLIIQQ